MKPSSSPLRYTLIPIALAAGASCATILKQPSQPPPPDGMPGTVSQALTPAAVPAVTVTPYKDPDRFKNARAYTPIGKTWLTTAHGITLVVQQHKPPRIEGGEGVWELKVYAFPREGQNVVTAKADQYGVSVANPSWPRPQPDVFTFKAVIRAPIECNSETAETEAHVILGYIGHGEKNRVREAQIALDDLCVAKVSSRPETKLEDQLD